jgi:hypothetical protein
MKELELHEPKIIKPGIKIGNAKKNKLSNKVEEESQVIIHCSFTGVYLNEKIRIWKSTYLYPTNSSHRSMLVHHENITMYPIWMPIGIGETVNFTLIFTGLPKKCKLFDLVENIPEPGGFIIKNIVRNDTDIYFLNLT